MPFIQSFQNIFRKRHKQAKASRDGSQTSTSDAVSSTIVGATAVDTIKKSKKMENGTKESNPTVSGGDAWIGRGILFLKLTKDVAEASDVLAPLKAACGAVVTLLEAIQAVGENKEAWQELLLAIKRHSTALNQQMDRIGGPDLGQETDAAYAVPVEEYQQTLQMILARVFEEANITEADINESKGNIKRFATRIGVTRIEAIVINRFIARLKESNDLLMTSLQLYIAKETGEMKETLGQVYGLLVTSSVVTENFRHGNQHLRCLEGTRDDMIQAIDQWARMTDQDRRVCFVEGISGIGKSTLAKEMVSRWEEDGLIAARFFFCRGQLGASNAGDVVRHLATDLARRFRPLRKIIHAILQDATLLTKPFATRWRLLVEQPLQLLDGSYVIVLDALDECSKDGPADNRTDTRENLLEAITQSFSNSSNIRVLVTASPEDDIVSALDTPFTHPIKLLSTPHERDSNAADLRRYIEHQFGRIRTWRYTPAQVDALVERSEDSFLFASTACAMLRRSLARSALLTEIIGSSESVGLDGLYLEVLKRGAPDAPSRQAVVRVLEAIITAPQPPTLSDLINQLPDVEDVSGLLHALSSVVRSDGMDDPIWIMHTTFREFLLDPSRALDFAVDIQPPNEEPMLT